ncbi:putative glycosyltransferase [Triangularia verruculosa]|uniref:Glycosyltransferase n=1 Tax=Triangularia verruculosa TaxID=2587418 RepID=A0AAN6XES5_9PEZI|nr:putative glycosyltransferase [Triangularia verruculosa]
MAPHHRLPRLAVSYGRARILRLAVLGCLACTILVMILQIGRVWFHGGGSGSHHHQQPVSPWKTTKEGLVPVKSREELGKEMMDYIRGLPGLKGEVAVLSKRVRVIDTKEGGVAEGRIRRIGRGFLEGHGFARVDLTPPGEGGDAGGPKQKQETKLPIPGVVEIPVDVPREEKGDPAEVLFGIASTYEKVSSDDFEVVRGWAGFLTNHSAERERKEKRRSNGAGLLLALNKATEVQVVEVKARLWQAGIDGTVFAVEERMGKDSDRYKGGVYAQLFQRLLMSRFGKGEVGGGKMRRWFAVVDDKTFIPDLRRLVWEMDTRFEEGGKWFVGFPLKHKDWKEGGDGKLLTYGGGAVMMSPSVLDTVGQLMCFQAGGKGGDDEEKVDGNWGETLYKCLEQERYMRMQVLVGEGGYIPGEDSRGQETSTGRSLVMHSDNTPFSSPGKGHLISNICGEECYLQRFLFTDSWALINGHSITAYPRRIEIQTFSKKMTQQKGSPTGNGSKKVAEKIVLHLASNGEGQKIAWRGGKTKTWRLIDAEVRDDGKEIWQAYVNEKGIGNKEEEKSDVDSVIVLVWEL